MTIPVIPTAHDNMGGTPTNLRGKAVTARDDYFKRDDAEWLEHTLAFLDKGGMRLDDRPVHHSPLSNEVASIPPRERVY